MFSYDGVKIKLISNKIENHDFESKLLNQFYHTILNKEELTEVEEFFDHAYNEKLSERYQHISLKNLAPKSEQEIEKEKEIEKREYLNKQDEIFGLNSLHLAVIKQNIPLLKVILKNELCDINVLDNAKCTPLHHSAVSGNKEIINLLIEYGANQSALNSFGGTYRQLMDLLQPIEERKTTNNYFFYKNENGEIEKGDASLFFQFTSSQLIDGEVICSKKEWVKSWKKACKEKTDFTFFEQNEKLIDFYREYKKQDHQKLIYLEKSEKVGYFVRCFLN